MCLTTSSEVISFSICGETLWVNTLSDLLQLEQLSWSLLSECTTVREADSAMALLFASLFAARFAFTAAERTFLQEKQHHCLKVDWIQHHQTRWQVLEPVLDYGAHSLSRIVFSFVC